MKKRPKNIQLRKNYGDGVSVEWYPPKGVWIVSDDEGGSGTALAHDFEEADRIARAKLKWARAAKDMFRR